MGGVAGKRGLSRAFTLGIVAACVWGGVVSAAAFGSAGTRVDFPVYMHDAGHSAYSKSATAIAPTTPLALQYRFTAAKTTGLPTPSFVSAPVVVRHVMYVAANSGDLYAVNVATGAVLWKKSFTPTAQSTCGNSRGFAATPAVATDPTTGQLTIYAPAPDGYVYALRASTGNVLWQTPVNAQTPGTNDYFNWSPPEIANGKVYVGIASQCDTPLVRGGLVALDQATGATDATFYTVASDTTGGSIWSSPAVAPDGSVVVTTGNGYDNSLEGYTQSVVRLDGATLTALDSWQVPLTRGDSDFGGSPTLFTARIHRVNTPMVGACNKDGNYYAWKLDALSAGPVWKVRIAPATGALICVGGAIWDGNSLYVAGTETTIDGVDYRGSMRKLAPATGNVLWATGLPAGVMTSPSMDGAGAIAAASYDAGTSTNSGFLFDAATGSYVTLADGGKAAASPVFADNSLIFANAKGQIYTYAPVP